jgi:hypothetical protein
MDLEYIGTSFIFSIFFFAAISLPVQGQFLRNESWVAMGAPAKVIDGQGLVIQQAIGQRSVTGVFTNSSIRVSQGFLFGRSSRLKEIKKPFEVIAFPNSFSERIQFRFIPDHSDQTGEVLTSIDGTPYGFIWTQDVAGAEARSDARAMAYYSALAEENRYNRARAYAVRCIKF